MSFYSEYKRLSSGSTCTAIGRWRRTNWFEWLLRGYEWKRYNLVFKHQRGFWDRPTTDFSGGKWEYSHEPH